MKTAAPTLLLLLLTAAPLRAQERETAPRDEMIGKGIELLLKGQEGDARAEWPYEGVYRVRGTNGPEIPIGYRIGGTAIVAQALVELPGYAGDEKREAAVARATKFIISGKDHPLMAYDKIRATYDVRGWGYAYGLLFLTKLKAQKRIPSGMEDGLEAAVKHYLAGIEATEIPKLGGWNYARRRGFDSIAAPSPFMTGSTLQALFQAKAGGYDVDPKVVARAIKALKLARTSTGSYVYAGFRNPRRHEPTPGSTGRMLVAETTLLLAGEGSPLLVRSAIDAFFTHWEWLDKRRAKTGTHIPPYMIAPYYFYYAHYFCAQAIEQLPRSERAEYRRKLRKTLTGVRLPSGGWNDRVFPRSQNYGTAMAIMALGMKDLPRPARYGKGARKGSKRSAQSPHRRRGAGDFK